jgi:predicted transcriptional regulator
MAHLRPSEVRSRFTPLLRSPSQREVFRLLVLSEGSLAAEDIAKELDMTMKAAHMALFHLYKKGLVKRDARGSYSCNDSLLKAALLDFFIDYEEKRRK